MHTPRARLTDTSEGRRTALTHPWPAPLGVGLTFQAPLRRLVDECSDDFDYLEVIPDMLWAERRQGRQRRYVNDQRTLEYLTELRRHLPIVIHSIGLSIGSAHSFDRAHVKQVAHWCKWLDAAWHSDHVSYSRVSGHAGEVNIGLTMPVTCDEASLRRIAKRASYIVERVPRTFLLENNVAYIRIPGGSIDEPAFLTRVSHESGCGLLLDLHNAYVNARNHGFDPLGFLSGLDLTRVVEIHIAGGMDLDGFYLDAHNGPTPPPVWDLLRWTMARAPNLAGVTFEVADDWIPSMGFKAIRRELARAREAWGSRPALTRTQHE